MVLDRYIIRQISWPILASFVFLNLIFLVVQILKVGELAAGADFGRLMQVATLFLPGFSVLTIPVSVLTGVLLGFGRMAYDEELVAIACAGIAPRRLFLPPLVVGLMATGLCILVANFLAPASMASIHKAFVVLSKEHIATKLKSSTFYQDIPWVVLYVRDKGGTPSNWKGFLMFDSRPDQTPYLMVANKAVIWPKHQGNYLDLRLWDGAVHVLEADELYTVSSFKKANIGIDIERMVDHYTRFISLYERRSLSELAAEAENPNLTQRERSLNASAMHRRFAFPLASTLFALLGCALASAGRIKGTRRMLIISITVVVFYYLFMRMGDALTEKGFLQPAWAAWMPNIFVLLTIVLLMTRNRRRLN